MFKGGSENIERKDKERIFIEPLAKDRLPKSGSRNTPFAMTLLVTLPVTPP
jgi:hypothetical protein